MPLRDIINRRFFRSRKKISLARLENFRKDVFTDHHTIDLNELCTKFRTDLERGLTSLQAQRTLVDTGPNALTPSHREPEYIKFLKILFQGFSMLLWIGAGLCFISVSIRKFAGEDQDSIDDLILGCVLVVVVVATACFTYSQEHKSQKIMESFENMVPAKATVIRDGRIMTIMSKNIVVGDLVEMQFGDRIPADIRITECQGFKVDNSALTGESEPQLRGTECSSDNVLETRNFCFFSTNAIEGTARGIVCETGDRTVIGRIAGLTARLKPNPSLMAQELDHFMRIITVWACILGFCFGCTAFALKYSWIRSSLFLIGIIVANVPEGLLATVTVCLSVTAKNMAAKNCVVKNLSAVETLGSTSIICSDKTGTLTQNKMTVCHVWCNTIIYEVDTTYEENSSTITLTNQQPSYYNTEGEEDKPVQQRQVRGDASEAAILKFVEITHLGGDPEEYRRRNHKIVEVPFNSVTKSQISIHAMAESGCLLVTKGAPESLLEKCSKIFTGTQTEEMGNSRRRLVESAMLDIAARGERVLGFADLMLDKSYGHNYSFSVEPPNFPQKGYRFLGFLAMIDPPRPQVPSAVEKCRNAGIRVVMVTGDHPITAKAIARQVGIITCDEVIEAIDSNITESIPANIKDTAIVIHGSTLRGVTHEELDSVLYNFREIVFARTSPTQKLQIIEGCQRIGEIAAATGDGVNDAPAIKKADVGIAMGITGSEVSQQSADIILLDDNFASIILGIEEGRKIFDNLKKSIVYTLASNIPEILPFLAFVVLNIPLPLGVMAILCIDLLTDLFPAISLGYEKAESDIMLRSPRNPKKDKLVTGKLYFLAFGHLGMIEAAAGFFVYFAVMAENGFWPMHLFGLRENWDSVFVNDLMDSYGQEWSYKSRKRLEHTCYTAFMISVVVTQWADLIVCKTRIYSIFQQGMENRVLNASLVIETVVACMLAYLPYTHYLKFYPVLFRWWCYSFPFSIFLFIFDEMRKWHIRVYPCGWFYRETYY